MDRASRKVIGYGSRTVAALLVAFDRSCLFVMRVLLRLAVAVDDLRRAIPRKLRRWHGSVRRVYRRWLLRHRLAPPPIANRGRRAWNRTPDHLEVDLVRLHVEQPALGAGQLRWLCERVLGFRPGRETVRRILSRRRDLVVQLQQERRRRPRRIRVRAPRLLWGADLTLLCSSSGWPSNTRSSNEGTCDDNRGDGAR